LNIINFIKERDVMIQQNEERKLKKQEDLHVLKEGLTSEE
jgi:hypothetical protein